MRSLMMTFAVSLVGMTSSVWAGPPQHAPAASPALDVGQAMSALPVSQADQPDEVPPLTVRAALAEALAHNPQLTVLRREYETLRHRPAQALALAPPSFEAQIWQWPLNTFNPRNTNMYMFTVGQTFPGRGKRAFRATVAQKDAELARAAIAIEAHGIVNEVKRVYADLFLVRREREIHFANIDLLRQFADVSEAKYVTGQMSQQDILKAVVELSRLHEDLVTLDEREQLAAARLNTLLDRPPQSAVGRLVEPREGYAAAGARRAPAQRGRPSAGAAGLEDRHRTDGGNPGCAATGIQAGLLRQGRLRPDVGPIRRLDGDGGHHLAEGAVGTTRD